MTTEAEAGEEEIRTVTLSPWAGIRVGAVIVSALSIALVLVFLLTGGGEELFRRKVSLRTYFADGTGLVRTANVELNGIQIGEVRGVKLSGSTDSTRAVEVDISVYRKYLESIPDDSRTEITADNLLGDRYINIKKGKSTRPISAGDELRAQPPTGTFDPGDLLASMQSILETVDTTLTRIESPTDPLGRFVHGDELYGQLLADVTGIQATIRKYDNPRTGLGQMVYGQALYQQLQQTVLDMDKLLADIQKGEGPAGKLYATSEMYDQLLEQVKSFHNAVAGFRDAPLMKQDDLYISFQETLKQLNETVKAFSASELLTSSQLYESLNGQGREAGKFVKDFRGNPQKFLRIKIF